VRSEASRKGRKRQKGQKERNIKKLLEMFVGAEIKLHVIYTLRKRKYKIDFHCPSSNFSILTQAVFIFFSNFIAETEEKTFYLLFMATTLNWFMLRKRKKQTMRTKETRN
jgi:hypothetical protein